MTVASGVADVVRRFAWGFALAGLAIPLLIEAAWFVGLIEWIVPPLLLDWVIVVWPWSRLLVHAEDAGFPLGVLIWVLTVALNVMLYTAVGALVGAVVGLVRRPA